MATHSSVLAWKPRDRGAWWAAVYKVAPDTTDTTQQQQQLVKGWEIDKNEARDICF